MADRTRMKHMKSQLHQVSTTIGEIHNRMEALENSMDWRIEGAVHVWRKESRPHTARLEEQMREQVQALKDHMQQFVLMLTH